MRTFEFEWPDRMFTNHRVVVSDYVSFEVYADDTWHSFESYGKHCPINICIRALLDRLDRAEELLDKAAHSLPQNHAVRDAIWKHLAERSQT